MNSSPPVERQNGYDIAITMGDPAGIGPEIICRALSAMSAAERATAMVIGDPAIYRRAASSIGAALEFVSLEQAESGRDHVAVGVVELPKGVEMPDGQISAGAGDMAFRCVHKAVELVQAGRAQVIVTAPLNKAALHEAGHHYDGHTGMLASLTGAP